MDGGNPTAPVSALHALLKSSLSADGSQSFGQLVLYTSFGVVRGRLGFAFVQRLLGNNGSESQANLMQEVIELDDASVEHYSNHLPMGSFDRLYVRLADVQGFALVDSQNQS